MTFLKAPRRRAQSPRRGQIPTPLGPRALSPIDGALYRESSASARSRQCAGTTPDEAARKDACRSCLAAYSWNYDRNRGSGSARRALPSSACNLHRFDGAQSSADTRKACMAAMHGSLITRDLPTDPRICPCSDVPLKTARPQLLLLDTTCWSSFRELARERTCYVLLSSPTSSTSVREPDARAIVPPCDRGPSPRAGRSSERSAGHPLEINPGARCAVAALGLHGAARRAHACGWSNVLLGATRIEPASGRARDRDARTSKPFERAAAATSCARLFHAGRPPSKRSRAHRRFARRPSYSD
jgi:hypothetical protein